MFGPRDRDRGFRPCRQRRRRRRVRRHSDGAHLQGARVDRLVDGLCARAPARCRPDEVRPDRLGGAPQAQLVGDPIPQRPGHLEAAAPRPRSTPLPLGAALRRRRPVAPTTAAARQPHGRPSTDDDPRRRPIAAQPIVGSSTRAQKISSRSHNASGTPGMLVPPSVGARTGTGHHDRNRAPTDGTGPPSPIQRWTPLLRWAASGTGPTGARRVLSSRHSDPPGGTAR